MKTRSALHTASASIAVALLLLVNVLPAHAAAVRLLAVAAPAPQAVRILEAAPGAFESVRDGYTITGEGPQQFGLTPYAHLADNFANNPTNTVVQWPFSHGVPVSSGFGPRVSPCHGCSSLHDGLDLAPGRGTPIEAIADGIVAKTGNPSGAFGVYVVIDHSINGQPVSSLYGHLLAGSLTVAVGDIIRKGQVVGKVGSTGASSGPHLHLGIYLAGTDAVDPYSWLKRNVGS